MSNIKCMDIKIYSSVCRCSKQHIQQGVLPLSEIGGFELLSTAPHNVLPRLIYLQVEESFLQNKSGYRDGSKHEKGNDKGL